MLLKSGAVLLRGLKANSIEEFNTVLLSFGEAFMNYQDGFSPRTKLSERVYTSTEYDADFFISLHNELSYSSRWPSRILFYCLIPSSEGGETPIADGRMILSKMNRSIEEEFKKKGVRYVRNLHSGKGLGPSWQQTFETDSRERVEEFCNSHQIKYSWKPDGGLRLIQVRPAIVDHHITREEVWFNQVDQFHPSLLDAGVYDALSMMYGDNEEELPMFGSFGDNSLIPVDVISEVRNTINDQAITFKWRMGDLLILDNEMACHGRMPFKGNRKILVSMIP